MSTDGFRATFRVRLGRADTWARLVGGAGTDTGPEPGEQCWLPGFDGQVTVLEAEPPSRLRATKDDQPCAGTDIVVVLEDDETGTVVRVAQSRFGDWLPARYDLFAVGWRYLVADLQTYLATGAHARRHLRPWGDLGAAVVAADGALRVSDVATGGLADDLGLRDGDLLVVVAGAPVASLDDLVTALRVQGSCGGAIGAEWIRDGALLAGSSTPA